MIGFICFVAILASAYFIVAKIYNSVAKRYNEEIANGTRRFDSWGDKASQKRLIPANTFGLIASIVVFVLTLFVCTVPAQECGVVVTPGGVKHESYPTGWHVIYPWYHMYRMDKTVQVYTCAKVENGKKGDSAVQSDVIWAPTADGIKMGFAVTASWRIDPEYAWWIYDNVSELDGVKNGRFYWLEENVIKTKLNSSLALNTSKYNPVEVYSNKREELQMNTFLKMAEDIKAYHLILDQVDIREVYYNSEYEQAINRKKLEEQNTLTLIEQTKQKQELLTQAEIQKNIDITKAQADAEALKIKGQSVVSNPKIIELEWIGKWNGQLPTYMMGNGQGVMLNFNK